LRALSVALRSTLRLCSGQALPPEISFFGASPSQEQKCFSLYGLFAQETRICWIVALAVSLHAD